MSNHDHDTMIDRPKSERRAVKCPRCGVPTGMTSTRTTLLIGSVYFLHKVTAYCTQCSAKIHWVPLPPEPFST